MHSLFLKLITSFLGNRFQRAVLNGQLNSDLEKISNWAHQWKMYFNVDPKKQVQEAIF